MLHEVIYIFLQVTIECKASEMVATVSTSTVFNGKVYARSRPNSCVEDIKNSTEFSIALPYNSVDCDVVQEGNALFASNIVIQVWCPDCLYGSIDFFYI